MCLDFFSDNQQDLQKNATLLMLIFLCVVWKEKSLFKTCMYIMYTKYVAHFRENYGKKL